MDKSTCDIAYDAYIFFYPMLEHYRTMLLQTDPSSSGYKENFNMFLNAQRLIDHTFKDVIRPNNDTLYSSSWLDLRTEPIVLRVPAVEGERYYSFQMVDMWTHNFAYVGTRTTGRQAGTYLIVGPNWNGTLPEGFDSSNVFKAESDFVFNLGRTQIFGQEDTPNVINIQNGYQLMPLSLWPDGPFSPTANSEGFTPAYDYDSADPKKFVEMINYLRGFINTTDYDQDEWAEFAAIGIGVENFDFDSINWNDVHTGITSAMAYITSNISHLGENQNDWIMMYNVFGDRTLMESLNNWSIRASAAQAGLFGNTMEEAFYPSTQYYLDDYCISEPLDTSQYNYTLEFTATNPIPKVNAFWSVTLYNCNGLFLPNTYNSDGTVNPNGTGTYSIGSNYFTDSSQFVKIYIQHDKPDDNLLGALGAWLPAPPQDIPGPTVIPEGKEGIFTLTMRLYVPDPSVLDAEQWIPPKLIKTPKA